MKSIFINGWNWNYNYKISTHYTHLQMFDQENEMNKTTYKYDSVERRGLQSVLTYHNFFYKTKRGAKYVGMAFFQKSTFQVWVLLISWQEIFVFFVFFDRKLFFEKKSLIIKYGWILRFLNEKKIYRLNVVFLYTYDFELKQFLLCWKKK